MKFGLICKACGKHKAFNLKDIKCGCGGAMRVEYDLELARRTLTKINLKSRQTSMWRYEELLPIEDGNNIVSLGEGWTPLVRLASAETKLPLGKLWVKREEQNPTGSFKARGFSAAVSIAHACGIRKVAVNSNGNAASALAAYAARAGMEAYVFLPRDCPGLIVEECSLYGAHTFLVEGLIQDAGRIVREGEKDEGWHNVGTLKEHGRAEGKKTMGLELAEQLDWKLPDVIVYPTGGGSGVFGMWNAFRQLRQLGLVDGPMPRIISVQETGCRPLVTAMERGSFAPERERCAANPTGMRVPDPPDGEGIVSILRASGGGAVAVAPEEIRAGQAAFGRLGISASPEGGATWAALMRLIDLGQIRPTDDVVLFNTAHAMKYAPHNPERYPVVQSYQEWLAKRT